MGVAAVMEGTSQSYKSHPWLHFPSFHSLFFFSVSPSNSLNLPLLSPTSAAPLSLSREITTRLMARDNADNGSTLLSFVRSINDPFWTTVGEYQPIGAALNDPLLIVREAPIESADLVLPSSVLRLQVERGDFPHSETRFNVGGSPPTDWAAWVDDVMEVPVYREILQRSFVLEAVLISRDLTLPRNDRSNENLEMAVSRWSVDTHTFEWAWGESGPTLEDTFALMRLHPRSLRLLDLDNLSSDETFDMQALCAAFAEAKRAGSRFKADGTHRPPPNPRKGGIGCVSFSRFPTPKVCS